ncbi:Rrf2 family transcriptional regulator [Peribacillus saganii]|uniref:HTH-type transcriptional regulator NsrR n=1 Tax=Peribacillus saganii TaxID=2303992 RepID=A0A372LDD0_9BACI|nr:Rrf2 family transcriptional regulator [Peribacillus saganii]RFU64080.1 Rrf2 family transcriptional regulator [Peribacillus saganii]
MRLTSYSDYSLRVLVYLASQTEDKLANIKEIAEVYQISKNHLMKIIYNLGKMGYIETIRGRNGGIRLARPASEINIGEIVRKTEEDFYLVECFEKHNNNCLITPVCSLKYIFNTALEAFLQVLDKYSLADVTDNSLMLREFFSIKNPSEMVSPPDGDSSNKAE